MTTKIFVGSLPEGTTTADVRELFEAHGSVAECDVIKDYGFVHMANDADAQAAIEALQGYEFRGMVITVEESRSRVRQKPGMGGKMTCFRCGRQGHWSKECRAGGGAGGPGGGRGRGGPYAGGPPFRGFNRPGPYDRPPPFDRRPPPAFEPQDMYGGRGAYDRFEQRGGGGGGGVYDRGYERADGGGYENYDDRRMDYYARRSPPRDDYYREQGPGGGGGYANGGGFARRPYGDRFGPPPRQPQRSGYY